MTHKEQADKLLKEISTQWRQCKKEYRDLSIKTGQQLQEFVYLSLKQYDNEPQHIAKANGCDHSKLILRAADEMNTTTSKVRELIRIGMAVKLLAQEGYVGELSYCALRTLSWLVYRWRGVVKTSKVTSKKGLPPLSSRETWQVMYPEKSFEIFNQAIQGEWKERRCREAVVPLLRKFKSEQSGRLGRGTILYTSPIKKEDILNRVSGDPQEFLEGMAKNGTINDLVDLTIGLMHKCENSREFAERLIHRLQYELKRERIAI